MTLIVAALLAWAGWVTLAWLPWPAWVASQIPAVAVLLALLLGDRRRWRPRQSALEEPRCAPPVAVVEAGRPGAVVVDLGVERERRRAA